MKKLIYIALFCSIAFRLTPLFAAENKTIYLVRHAEKISGAGKDPQLTEIGLQRAQRLAELLRDKNIGVIFSTNYQRTLQTAQPLAQLLNLTIQQYDPAHLPAFAESIRKLDSNLLIVGHSNTTPELVQLLGGENLGEIDESEYGRLYQLTINENEVKTVLLSSNDLHN